MTTLRALSSHRNQFDRLIVAQAFCRLMLQISLIAIPVYLGLFMLAVPFDIDAGKTKGVALSVPVMVFLLAAIVYAVGFLATPSLPQRELLDETISGQRQLARLKLQSILLGSGIFATGVIAGALILIKAHL